MSLPAAGPSLPSPSGAPGACTDSRKVGTAALAAGIAASHEQCLGWIAWSRSETFKTGRQLWLGSAALLHARLLQAWHVLHMIAGQLWQADGAGVRVAKMQSWICEVRFAKMQG